MAFSSIDSIGFSHGDYSVKPCIAWHIIYTVPINLSSSVTSYINGSFLLLSFLCCSSLLLLLRLSGSCFFLFSFFFRLFSYFLFFCCFFLLSFFRFLFLLFLFFPILFLGDLLLFPLLFSSLFLSISPFTFPFFPSTPSFLPPPLRA